MATLLKLDNLTTGYQLKRGNIKEISAEIELTIVQGEFICLLGVNGAGKSTLIRTICGFQKPLHGCVMLNDSPTSAMSSSEIARLVSVVLTERPQIGAMTVFSLVALGRHPYTGWTGRLTDADNAIVNQAIHDAGATSLTHRYVSELSDGELQKVMIARALAQEPSLMILDEPTAFLDLPRTVELMRMLKTFAHTHGKAVICATHDISQALETADRIWLIDESGCLHDGAPEDLVLEGILQKIFNTDEVFFDSATATFKMQHHSSLPVKLIGDGDVADWTTRALERVGFHVENESDLVITINDAISPTTWTIEQAGKPLIVESLQELLSQLRKA